MRHHFYIAGFCALGISLAGCASDGSKPTSQIQGLADFTYAANGKVYKIDYKYDDLLRAYGIAIYVVSGASFTGASTEDPEAQNTIRDAFRNQKLCGNLNPGILEFGYASFKYNGQMAWGAKVRCSETLQKNV
ncbi:MAG: hypothetical protein JNM13_07185 [Hyphomicrobiaceae bacterium]|nr:hypothetical protein [Hyphomicrobiaceae bacterium]